ncbi:MAG: NAD(+) synthase, partial [Muribaculaceae bacterium]|nr:NAD(+) synthase [Muribaculaceae bacterium]
MSLITTRNRGYIRVAACTPHVAVGDVDFNVRDILNNVKRLDSLGVELAVFPELSVTGYTCDDLFHSRLIIDKAQEGIETLCRETASLGIAFAVGAPREREGRLFNAGILIHHGKVVIESDKTFIPNYDEFYERRFFTPSVQEGVTLYDLNGVKVGIEICEDLWTPVPVSSRLALAGADVVLNLSASDDTTGKYDYLLDLVRQQSARCVCGYVYASAGFGESSTDLVFDGKCLVAENGSILAASERWQNDGCDAVADIDVELLRRDRLHKGTFYEAKSMLDGGAVNVVPTAGDAVEPKACDCEEKLMRPVSRRPFVPSGDENRSRRCNEIVGIQVAGLAKRLHHTHCRSLVVGVSGGLDSTLALLVARRAFDRLGLDPKGIIAVTMPGFGTTGRTYNNAVDLASILGVSLREISIVPAVEQHFKDIGHDPEVHDVTYENSQARQRTLLLMDIANQSGGMVLGTGDLSELALGWATYNGDHMSMYGVNAGVPKTLVRHLVEWFAYEAPADSDLRRVL